MKTLLTLILSIFCLMGYSQKAVRTTSPNRVATNGDSVFAASPAASIKTSDISGWDAKPTVATVRTIAGDSASQAEANVKQWARDTTFATTTNDSTTAGYGLVETANALRVDTSDVATLYRLGSDIHDSLTNLVITVEVLPSGIDTLFGLRNDTIYIMPISAITAPLQAQIDSQGNLLSIIYDFLAAQGNDLQTPSLDSIVLGGLGPSDYIFRLYFNEQLNQDSIPSHLDFTVTENGNAFNLSSSGVSNNMVTVSGATPAYGNTYLLSYAKGDTAIQDTAGNKVANWTGHTVVNRLPAPDTPSENMLSNGTFDSGTDWYFTTAAWSIGSGVATFTGADYSAIYQEDVDMISSIQINTHYKLTFTVSGSTGDGARFRISSVANEVWVNYANFGNGTHTVDFTTGSDVYGGGLKFLATTQSACTLDNIILELY